MNQRNVARLFSLLSLVSGLGACALFSDKGPGKVEDLVSSVERVYVEAELSKERSQVALEKLEAIVAPGFDEDAVSAYKEYMKLVERSEDQAQTLRTSIERMEEIAAPLFTQWTADLEAFTSPQMRERSRARLEATRRDYEAVVAAAELVRADYFAFNQSLRDHALFLGHDFNPASIAEVRDDVSALGTRSVELSNRLDSCLVASRAYVDRAALPGEAPEDRVEKVRGTR